jgi:predicted O-methyltransferase YrrM
MLEAYRTGEVRQHDGTTVAMFSNVQLEEAERLYSLVSGIRPALSVEIGLAQGLSAMAIAQAVADNGVGMHHVVDPLQRDFGYAGVANIERAGLAHVVEVHEAYPETVVPSLPVVQFAFIDGSHLFDLTIVDFVLIDKRLDVGGIVGLHDLWMPSLQKLLRYVLANRHYEVYEDVPPPPSSSAQRRRERVAKVARRVPRAEQLFRPEVLDPGPELGDERSMVFLRKLADDDRIWTNHSTF